MFKIHVTDQPSLLFLGIVPLVKVSFYELSSSFGILLASMDKRVKGQIVFKNRATQSSFLCATWPSYICALLCCLQISFLCLFMVYMLYHNYGLYVNSSYHGTNTGPTQDDLITNPFSHCVQMIVSV